MKKIIYLVLLLIPLLFTSCTKAIDLELETATPKLVVQASIDWQKGTSGEEQSIKLTTTMGYYEKTAPIASGASVFIKNNLNEQFDFIEVAKTGEYLCSNFKPVLDEQYTLTIIYNGQTYVGSETMKSVAPITHMEEKREEGYKGLSINIEIKAYFNDPANADNLYMFKLDPADEEIPFILLSDNLFQGNEYSSRFSSGFDKSTFNPGDERNITFINYGISERYYNYLKTLLNITANQGGKFQPPSVKLKGNMQNITDKDNYPLGYFSLSETDTATYTVEF